MADKKEVDEAYKRYREGVEADKKAQEKERQEKDSKDKK